MASRVGEARTSRFSLWQLVTSRHAARRSELREREHIQHAALCCVFTEIAHGIQESQRPCSVHSVQAARYGCARPATHAREDRDVLLAVRSLVGDRLANDAGPCLKFPKRLSVSCV